MSLPGVCGQDGGIPGVASLPRIGRCHNGTMTDGSSEPVSENDLITPPDDGSP